MLDGSEGWRLIMISVAAFPQPSPSRSCAAHGAVMGKELPGTTSSLQPAH